MKHIQDISKGIYEVSVYQGDNERYSVDIRLMDGEVLQGWSDIETLEEANRLSSAYLTGLQVYDDNQHKECQLNAVCDVIARLDRTAIDTIWLDKAIKRLQDIKHVRESIPF